MSACLVKGFALDDERLKNPPGPGVPDYFDELLERIRDIHASERWVYLRVKETAMNEAETNPARCERIRYSIAAPKCVPLNGAAFPAPP